MQHMPTGWNTWDFRGFNRLVYLQKGRTKITLVYGVWDEAIPCATRRSQTRQGV